MSFEYTSLVIYCTDKILGSYIFDTRESIVEGSTVGIIQRTQFGTQV